MEYNAKGRSRRVRIKLSIDGELEVNLKRLAVSCNMPATTLAAKLIEHCLLDANVVDLFQMDYNAEPRYWVIPYTHRNGKRRLEVVKR